MPPHLRPIVLLILIVHAASLGAAEPLASWADGPTKAAIEGFVRAVTDESGPDFVPPTERIAVFDNDGTLWPEQPAYFQVLFAMDRIKTLAPEHPQWRTEQPFEAVVQGGIAALQDLGHEGLLQIIAASHAGMTTEQFEQIVQDWIRQTRHPRFQRPVTDLAFQPMLELLDYLRANGFKIHIVSGGGIEFMRPWTEAVYGIPPEQVIGSRIRVRYELRDGVPVLVRLPEVDFINDKAGKPVGIHQSIGRRPIFAAGNSDGDLEMLQWTTAGDGPRFALIVHHTDAEREWAYDRKSHVGRLDKALSEAKAKGWTVVDMQRDWERVFAFEAIPVEARPVPQAHERPMAPAAAPPSSP